jgi:hypothetical protein
VGDLWLSLADEPGDDHMTTNAVRALPGEVLFQVEVMRQEMKTVKMAPHKEVAAAIEKMEGEINLSFERQARLPRKWLPKRASTNFGEVGTETIRSTEAGWTVRVRPNSRAGVLLTG